MLNLGLKIMFSLKGLEISATASGRGSILLGGLNLPYVLNQSSYDKNVFLIFFLILDVFTGLSIRNPCPRALMIFLV